MHGSLRRTLLITGLCVATFLGAASIAYACGVFRANTVPSEAQPTLSREKVLIIHDAEEGVEHFIREVAFAKAGAPFGFVVPTPTLPTVSTVEKNLFTPLRKRFGFKPAFGGRARRGKGIGGEPASAGDGAIGVTVLSVQQVGSFKAFVLKATDEKALAKWLADNDLASSAGTQEWLAHYVRMGFHYVAMRFDPPKGKRKRGGAPVGAETIRISFATPLPYYPYLEPVEPDLPRNEPRLLEVWYAGSKPVVPVSLREYRGTRTWTRPLRAGSRYGDALQDFAIVIDAEVADLLPDSNVVVQTFQDQKKSRDGFGDILFVAEQHESLTEQRRAELAPLLGILDPELVPKRAQGKGQ